MPLPASVDDLRLVGAVGGLRHGIVRIDDVPAALLVLYIPCVPTIDETGMGSKRR
jgi:hypothetical protein